MYSVLNIISESTYFAIQALLHTLFCLTLKSFESLQCILNYFLKRCIGARSPRTLPMTTFFRAKLMIFSSKWIFYIKILVISSPRDFLVPFQFYNSKGLINLKFVEVCVCYSARIQLLRGANLTNFESLKSR